MSADDETTAPDGQTASEPDAAKASAAKKPAAAKKAPAEKKPAASAEKKAPAEKKPAAKKPAAKKPAAEKKPAGDRKASAAKKAPAEEQPAEEQPTAERKPAAEKKAAASKQPAAEQAVEKPAKAPAAPRAGKGGPAKAPRRRVVAAHARYVRTSARKARMVCGHLRGKSVQEARAILAFTPREVARDWSKLLESAVANAESNHELLEDDLIVREAYADEGPTIKRFRPRAMGRATPIRKRTSHLTITLTPRPEPATNKRNR
jgi:ribosomal protein L22